VTFDHNDEPIIVGCGFLGKYLTRLLHHKQQTPHCIVRSQHSLTELQTFGWNAQIIDLDASVTSDCLSLRNRDVYYFAPPSTTALCDYRIDQLLKLCLTQPPKKIVYISTSGVYGDCHGHWVDETQSLKPISDRAKRRVYAESALQHYCQSHSSNYVILRVGGIYGRERLPIKRLNNITVVCPDEAPYSNRIHVADLANICYTAMIKDVNNEIINVADGHATSMTDYYYKIADYAGHTRPPCVPMSQANEKLSAGMLSFINESRRLSVQKMNVLLDVELQFPTLDLGLKNCFSEQP